RSRRELHVRARLRGPRVTHAGGSPRHDRAGASALRPDAHPPGHRTGQVSADVIVRECGPMTGPRTRRVRPLRAARSGAPTKDEMSKGSAIVGFLLCFLGGMALMWGIDRSGMGAGGHAELTKEGAYAAGEWSDAG